MHQKQKNKRHITHFTNKGIQIKKVKRTNKKFEILTYLQYNKCNFAKKQKTKQNKNKNFF